MTPMALLFVALFNSVLGLSVLFPVLAPLGQELGLSETAVGSLSTAYALMQFLLAPVWGRASEKRGRRPILLIGILGFALAFLGFAAVAHLGLAGILGPTAVFAALLGTRVVGGCFSSATIPTAQAYAADLSTRERRASAMAVIGAAFGLGVIFGPAIGFGLSWLCQSLLAPVYFSGGLALLNALFVQLSLPEPDRKAYDGDGPGVRTVLSRTWPLLSVGMVATLSSVAMEQTVAFYFRHRLGLDALGTAKAVGIALVGYGLVAVAAQGYLARRTSLSPRVLLVSGVPIAAVGLVLFVFATDYVSLTAALLIQGLGQGLTLPGVTAAVSLSVGEDAQGSVAGLNGSAQGLARMVGPLLGTFLYEHVRHEAPYAMGAALLLLVLLALVFRPRLGRGADEPPEVVAVSEAGA